MTVVAENPLPYLPIKIIDVSPFRTPVRRPATRRGRPGRRVGAAAAAVALVALAVVAAANTGAANVGEPPADGDVPGQFRLAPGHAVPAALKGSASGDVSGDVRLAPGHATPPSLAR